jgi:hypothetical protein
MSLESFDPRVVRRRVRAVAHPAASRRGLLLLALVVGLLAVLALLPSPGRPAAAAQPQNGTYTGKSTQSLPLKFRVRNGVVTGQLFKIKGSGGCTLNVFFFPPAKTRPDGTFKLASGGMTVTGRFVTSTRATGTISARQACPSAPARVRYTANRVS